MSSYKDIMKKSMKESYSSMMIGAALMILQYLAEIMKLFDEGELS